MGGGGGGGRVVQGLICVEAERTLGRVRDEQEINQAVAHVQLSAAADAGWLIDSSGLAG